jgi:hypothetical protein
MNSRPMYGVLVQPLATLHAGHLLERLVVLRPECQSLCMLLCAALQPTQT